MRKLRRQTRVSLSKYLYILPLIVLVLFVYVYPLIRTIIFSFYKIPFGQAVGEFIGFENYINIVNNFEFWISLRNNFVWAFANLVIQLTIATIIAAFLNAEFKGKNLALSAVLLPWIIPTVAVASVIRWVLLPHLGIVNVILQDLKVIGQPINFLSTENAMMTLISLSSWRFIPIGVLLVLAAIQTIPKEIYESTRVDGANSIQQFFFITYPMVNKMLWFTGFIIFVWNFNILDLIWLITQGGPGMVTQTLPIMVFRTAFRTMRLGESSAIAVIIAGILVCVGIIYFSLMKKGEKE